MHEFSFIDYRIGHIIMCVAIIETIIETKVDFLLTYFKKVVIIIECEHSYIITCNGERWLSLAIFFYVKT
ncbi:hypothetical protein LSA36186_10190 [Lachnoanaerobaculum sp. JCM 36186]|nr:hypothetical protein LSA36186_10190 [Lachnoanaerobaculum sp. JCM 36186]